MNSDDAHRDPSHDDSDLTKPPSRRQQPIRHNRGFDSVKHSPKIVSGPSSVTDADHETVDHLNGSELDESTRDLPCVDGSEPTDFGDYQLLEEIARGGMGAVFKALHKRLNRTVALKVILAGQFATEEDVQRFQSEAQAAAILQHVGIVPIYEVGEVDGRHFFSMSFVEGTTLGASVAAGPLDGRQAAGLLYKIADAVSYAHERGVVHRDLKPGNILIDEAREPHVTDFGLAERIDSNSQSTGAGQVTGTPNYMSPEQALGSALIGMRSDVYSLGAILYCLLTGRPPFQADTAMKTLRQVIKQEPVPPRQRNPSVDKDLEAICLKCLQKDPEARYQSARELKADLERFLNDEPIEARPISTSARAWRWSRRNRVVSTLGGSLVILVLGLAVVSPLIAIRQATLRAEADHLVLVKEALIDNLNNSFQATDTARKQAEMSAHALHESLVEMYVDRGNREIELGDPVAALPWYAAGLALDAGDPALEWGHRFRLASILQQAAPPLRIWQLSGETYVATISPNGELVAAGSRGGDVAVWDVSSGDRVFVPKRGRNSAATALQFSSDSKRLLHAAGSGFQVWDLTTGDRVFPEVRCGATKCAHLDTRGERIAVGLRNGKVLLYNAQTGKLELPFSSHSGRVLRVELRALENRLLSCGDDNAAQLSDLETGKLIARFDHEDHVVWAEFDPTGTRIVTASDDGTAKLWSAETGESIGDPLVHPARVRVASFDPTGTRLATGAWDSAARIWDVQTGDLIAGPMMHKNSIPRLDFSPDGKYLITASLDHTARIWDSVTASPVSAPLQHGFLLENAQFFPNGGKVMTASADRTIRVWEFRPLPQLVSAVRHHGTVNSCRLSPDGKRLLTASSDGTARVWDAETGESKNIAIEHRGEVMEAAFSPDGKLLVTASEDGTARVCSVTDGIPVTPALQHNDKVWHAEFSIDGDRVLTASDDGAARIWDPNTGELIHELRHGRSVRWATFGPQGLQVLTCSEDRSGRVWDARTGTAISPPLRHSGKVEGGGFSPDGKFVVTASNDHTAQIWEVSSGKKITSPLTHTGGIYTASFTPDGQYVVTGARDGSAQIWSVTDGTAASPPLSIGRGLVRAVISPCGKFIATAGGHGARLWDANSGQLLAGQMRHHDWINEVRFSPDSRMLVSAGEDGFARAWRLPEPDHRPAETLQQLADLISGYHVDSLHGLRQLTATELQDLLRVFSGE